MNNHKKHIHHTKLSKDESPVTGAEYTFFTKDSQELFNAKICKYTGGCWGTIEITSVSSPSLENIYSPGMKFDVKMAMYDFSKIEPEVQHSL
jgi:hypothetical protein